MLCGTDSNLQYISSFRLNVKNIPFNNVMDTNNVMWTHLVKMAY